MKRTTIEIAAWCAAITLAAFFATNPVQAQDITIPPVQPGFVDIDGNGVNDNAPDIDNDGVPNGLDTDFARGTGLGVGTQENWIDEDADGICDTYQGGAAQVNNRRQAGVRNFQNNARTAGNTPVKTGPGAGNGNTGVCPVITENPNTTAVQTPNSGVRAQYGKNRNK